ncbi:MBL fold metallo-hydrolase [Lichenifustis flavocetrariae]|uniref:MBL fold metallo-hydrolase n=1 Tax=Lichenifustis flavocetrariae TaxID=2949735 RepID=A0AA41YX96_9HYPH|nr:MBL fold metallo-hydrolase [Lichenifustis flavocetrariae]MCW6508921.1 MBL fold metallo-hydrolase [Lichenifustis flavocetrariae]
MTDQPDVQAPSLNRRKVGDFVVTYLSDGFLDGSFSYLQGIDAHDAASMLEAAHRPPLPHISIASFVVQGGGRTILIDSGTGGFSGWGGRFPVALAAAGVEPDSVDTILISHGHVDHVGGLTLYGQPLFKNADVVVNDTELKFWRDDTIMNSVGEDAKPFFVAARTAFDAYESRLRPVSGGEVVPGISLVPLPGHTPGHSGFHISSGKDNLLIWTDIVHMADIQVARPEVTIGFDVDPDQARATRMKVLDQAASDRLLIAGMHLNMPGFMTIERRGNGYAKVDMPWTPALL